MGVPRAASDLDISLIQARRICHKAGERSYWRLSIVNYHGTKYQLPCYQLSVDTQYITRITFTSPCGLLTCN